MIVPDNVLLYLVLDKYFVLELLSSQIEIKYVEKNAFVACILEIPGHILAVSCMPLLSRTSPEQNNKVCI